MPQSSPIRAGVDALRREPAVVLAEIAWRWAFGAAAIALSTASLMVYLSTLTVSRAELLGVRSRSPWLVVDAVVHILSGSGPRLALIVFWAATALTIAWIAAASLGRAATLTRLCNERIGYSTLAQNARVGQPPTFGRIVLLHVVRAVFFWVSTIAFIGATILADRAARAGSEPSFGVYALVFLSLSLVITFAHSRVSWLASVAAIFVMLYGVRVAPALERSIALYARRPGQITKINTIFGVVHFAVFLAAGFMSLSALALLGQVPAGVSLGLFAVIMLAYFAFADFLYIARVAAYVSLIEGDGPTWVAQPGQPGSVLPSSAPAPPLESPA